MQKFKELIEKSVLFDSHCHLNGQEYDDDRDEVVARAKEAGVKAIVDVGVSIESSKKALKNTKKYDIVYAAVGIDMETLVPGSELFDQEVFELNDSEFEAWLEEKARQLDSMIARELVLMVGETGIDDYWLKKSFDDGQLTTEVRLKSIQRQEELFRMHIKLAKKYDKPLSVHSRNAIDHCLRILEEEDYNYAVFHSLTPDNDDDQKNFYRKVNYILDAGFRIGINGIVTFTNAHLIKKVYTYTLGKKLEDGKMEKLKDLYKIGFVLETDGPYLSPYPHRGERNEPGYLKYILKELKGM